MTVKVLFIFDYTFEVCKILKLKVKCCSQDEVMGKQISILFELLVVVCSTDVIAVLWCGE